ncbi:NAD(P)/FAD-dependent oxidoreductase [Flavobacterium sp. '19STA2R22 D10 B1']|uniref:NAD(P)/FAD-dependent oxidoreductase n=1 Tax=Flavobacterium aerium TaxID=3037261 RepID=UPI00278C5F89|nr:FAD-binding oxidoreductase [Flavobacterium sp. '19STA2R22 D10 B1']
MSMKLRSNEPFWLVKNGIINSYPSQREDAITDILIVGGGITGSLIAHQCMEEGYKTMLIDRREIANGSTSATTSMLQYEIDVPLYQLIEQIGEQAAVDCYWACFKSIDDLGKVVKKVNSDCGFKKKESLYFAAYKKDVKWLKEEFEARKKHGFPVQWMEPKEIEQKYKLTNTFGGILSQQGGSIDAFRLAHDILEFNHKRGLIIYDKTDVQKVDYKQNGVTVVTEYGNTIKAKKIIYCNGFESVELIKDNFVKLLSTYAMVGEIEETNQSHLNDTLFWNTAIPYLYMRTTDDNRILIGGEDEEFVDASKRDALLHSKSIKLEKQLDKLGLRTNFRTDFVWAGTFGETKDGLPYIGIHPNFKSTYFVLGFGGNGITFSVIGMDMVTAMLKNEKHPLQDYFRFRR